MIALPTHLFTTGILPGLSNAATGSLVAAIWQGTLLAGAGALGLRLLPKTPAAVRFAIWFAAFLLAVALPVVTLAAPHASGMSAPHAAWLTLGSGWSETVLALWLVASASRAIALLVGAVQVSALWRRATPLDPTALPVDPAELGRNVQVCTSSEVDRPSVIGFLSPRILIPDWLVAKLTPEEMAQVVLHEAGHLHRADDWLNLLQKIALVVFPLNPALAWIERRLCFERELACDERVLRATGAPKAYATCLATLAEHRITRRGLALVMGVLGRESELGRRVLRILSRSEGMRPAQARLVFTGAVFALAAGAVGLEHCPQLIRFGDASAVQAENTSTHMAPSSTGTDAYVAEPAHAMAQSVSFHATSAAAPIKTDAVLRIHRGSAAAGQPKPLALAPHATDTVAKPDADSRTTLVQRKIAYSPGFSAQWIVVTSYRVSAPGAPRTISDTPVSDATTDGDAPQPEPRQAAPQVHPYAAVPVQGGWLVIQL